jgi:aspartate aminotransferase
LRGLRSDRRGECLRGAGARDAACAQGRDIINLGIGQPDFRTPDFIVEAAVKALRDGHHGYTPANGILPLREAVAADLHKRFGSGVAR